MNIKCKYRNCHTQMVKNGKRVYCSENCRKMESTYKLRKKKTLNSAIESERRKVEEIKRLKDIICGTFSTKPQ